MFSAKLSRVCFLIQSELLEGTNISVVLTGAGGLFTRIGKEAKLARNANGVRGSADPVPASLWAASGPTIGNVQTLFGEIYGQYEANNSSLALVAGLPQAMSSFQQSVGSINGTMKDLAAATLIKMVNDDTPLISPTLQNAMTVLISQMNTAGTHISGNTVTATVTVGGSNVGTPKVVASVIDQNGLAMQYPFAENIAIATATDATHGATLGNEQLSASGKAAVSDPLDYLWPGGSGISNVTFNITDWSEDAAGGNLLTNSNFELFTTPNLPDKWTRNVGVLGTDIVRGATHLSGTYSLSYVGDGATLSSVQQLFGNATTGTAGAITAPPVGPQTSNVTSGVYAFGGWVLVDVPPAAGTLKIDLVDGGGTVINDNAGTPNSITRVISTLTGATWTFVSGFFRLPTTLPATVSIRVHLTTAITGGSILFMDDFATTPAVQVYAGGPFVAAFRGTADVVLADTFQVAIANNLGTPGGGGVFTEWFERFFSMRSGLGMTIPIAGGGALVNDSLVA